jgi:soluble lytic murein transglycosylase
VTRRFFFLLCCLSLLAGLPASAITLYPLPDDHLSTAAARMKAGDFAGAREAAEKARGGGARDFVAAMAAFKATEWEAASLHFSRAVDSFPLLADYALANMGEALANLGRFEEAAAVLEKLVKSWPDSPVARAGALRHAEMLQAQGNFPGAIVAYRKFIEKFPAGNDSLTALYQSALCRDRVGETSSAVTSLRHLWLNNPASPVAARAEQELRAMAARGIAVPPYNADELYRRATALYDLKKYALAATAFRAIPLDGKDDEARARLTLRTGQALLKSRQYKDAEQMLGKVTPTSSKKGISEEGQYWLAKARDKNGRDDSAAATFLSLAETAPSSELADDSLMDAALIRKWQNRWPEALGLLNRLVRDYPQSNLKASAEWEIAWLTYLTGDRANAAVHFKKLAGSESYREKALYWLGRSLAATGNNEGAVATFNELLASYPLGYYAFSYRKEAGIAADRASGIPVNPREQLPVPAGFERVKALISFGLNEEARRELASHRKKGTADPKLQPALARLYLEMDDYYNALAVFNGERPLRFDAEPAYVWGISYPLAFREMVRKHAAANGVAENLVYAVIRAESSFSPTVKSPAGAIGLMQLMPATAAEILGSVDGAAERLTRPNVNIGAGVRHLQDLIVLHKGDLVAAIASYNAGSGNVKRWRKSFGHLPPAEFIEMIPYGETREYVKKVLTYSDIYHRLYQLGTPTGYQQLTTSPGKGNSQPANSPEFTVESRLVVRTLRNGQN